MELHNEQEALLLDALVAVRTEVEAGRFPRWGICCGAEEQMVRLMKEADGYKPSGDDTDEANLYVYAAEDIIDQYLQPVFEEWPRFSGSHSYPVPGPGGVGHHSFFSQAVRAQDPRAFWTGEYGRSRRDLLDFCIDYLTKELS